MSIKNFFNRLLHENEDFRKIEKQLIEIDCHLQHLKELIQQQKKESPQKSNQSSEPKENKQTLQSPTIIEQVNVEKIIIDRYEQSNNFGALGIKSLEGRLNIGANYGLSKPIPKAKKEKYDQKMKKVGFLERNKPNHKKTEEPLKWNIKSR
ncbi:hypothetical protein [Scopulibacillus cellulosilyticus]|uniref:Uncharacterized protein n=1 Tax=Scopulibacillus cellulosilyticus TaxID=2665665 RepID=A0ABW2PUL0_9BACL